MSEARLHQGPLFEAIAREVAGAVVALVGETTTLVAQTTVPQPVWTTALRASGALAGTIRVGLTEEDGRRISGLVLGLDEGTPAADDAVLDTLREIGRQAVGALAQAPEAAGVGLAVEDVWRAAPESTGMRAWRFTLPGGAEVSIVLGGELAEAADEATPARETEPDAASAPGGVHLDLLLDLDLPLSVRFGQTQLTVQSLTRLAPGSVIDLHRSLEEPVEVLVSGRVVARGEVVVVDGNYGVRVTEVVSTADRIRSLGA